MKKYLFVLVMITLFLIPSLVSAKSYQVDIFNYGGWDYDFFKDVEATPDEGYIAIGSVWANGIEGLTSKGGQDAVIVKYDNNNDIEWQQNYGGEEDEEFYSIRVTADEGYIVVGSTLSDNIDGLINNGYRDALIIKYDKDGNIEWQQIYGGRDYEYFRSVIVTPDDEYVVVGESSSTDIDGVISKGGYDGIIVKYDKDGNLLWQQNYGGSGSEGLYDVTVTENEDYVAVGFSDSTNIEGMPNKGNWDALIIKYDKNGNLEWQQNYGGSKQDSFEAITITSDDEFVVVGSTLSDNIDGLTIKGARDAIIIKFDGSGKLVWQQNYGGEKDDRFYGVNGTADDGYIVAGGTYSTDINDLTNKGQGDSLIVKYEKNGNLVWQQNYGGSYFEWFNAVLEDSYGNYVAVGESASTDIEGMSNKGYIDAIVVKIKPIYDITEEKTTNGEFKVIQVGKRGKIEVKPSFGYVVERISVTDSLDNDVPTYKENDNYYFDLYDDVKVRITFKEASILDIINPETGSGQVVEFIAIVILIIGGLVYFNKKKTLKG